MNSISEDIPSELLQLTRLIYFGEEQDSYYIIYFCMIPGGTADSVLFRVRLDCSPQVAQDAVVPTIFNDSTVIADLGVNSLTGSAFLPALPAALSRLTYFSARSNLLAGGLPAGLLSGALPSLQVGGVAESGKIISSRLP